MIGLIVLSELVFSDITKLEVSSVSDFSYTMGGIQSVSITFTEKGNNKHFFDLTVHRDKIKKGFKNTVNKWSPKMPISANASWEGYHKLWNKDKTNLTFKVKELDKKYRKAILSLKSTLYNPDTKKTISFDLKDIVIKGKLFDNLVKTIKNN